MILCTGNEGPDQHRRCLNFAEASFSCVACLVRIISIRTTLLTHERCGTVGGAGRHCLMLADGATSNSLLSMFLVGSAVPRRSFFLSISDNCDF